ncbi:antirestriction protein ArdA, partial [Acinetobacter baumannii]
DFGRYLIDECSALEIPEDIQGYFDYERYGRDALISDYLVAEGKVYRNY